MPNTFLSQGLPWVYRWNTCYTDYCLSFNSHWDVFYVKSTRKGTEALVNLKKFSPFMIFIVKVHLKWMYHGEKNFLSVLIHTCSVFPTVYKPDRAWQPIPQPGAGVPMGQHAAAPRPRPRRVPRSRHLPHKARFWSRRYARYCIFLDRGLCRLSADICFHSQRGWLQVLPR